MVAILASLDAGNAIMEVFRTNFSVDLKSDESPVTIADHRAHEVIAYRLSALDLPILSEEGAAIPYEDRHLWHHYWLVDPLDGTKEFIKGRENFTVNIALMESKRPLAGIVYVPAHRKLFFSVPGKGAYRVRDIDLENGHDLSFDQLMNLTESLPIPRPNNDFVVAVSQSHRSQEAVNFILKLEKHYSNVVVKQLGSALKICMVAEGTVDLVPRFGPTMEWDTAAGQALVEATGKKLYHYHNQVPLTYNKPNLINDWFIVGAYPFD